MKKSKVKEGKNYEIIWHDSSKLGSSWIHEHELDRFLGDTSKVGNIHTFGKVLRVGPLSVYIAQSYSTEDDRTPTQYCYIMEIPHTAIRKVKEIKEKGTVSAQH